MDDFDATVAGRAIATFVDELSNWYVRRSRRRFWDGDPAAFATLRECLLTVAKLLAPFCPFVADEIYDNLDGSRAERSPVRLPGRRRARRRARARRWTSPARRSGSGSRRAARPSSRSASRCARRSSWPPASNATRSSAWRRSIRDELNVRELRFVSEVDELGRVEVKPNYRTLGPQVRQADAAGGSRRRRARRGHVPARACASGELVAITIGGQDHELSAEDLLVAMQPLEGYQVEREGSHAVALELEIDDDLRREGWARDIVHAVQNGASRRGPRDHRPDRADARRRRGAGRRGPRHTSATSRRRRSRSGSATSRSTGPSTRCGSTAVQLKIGVALA